MGIARTIARNTIYELITNVSELGIAFVVGIVLTRGLGPEQYGLYAYTIWLLGLASLGTNLGFGEMSRRFIPEAMGRQDTREAAGFVQLSFISRITASIVVFLAILFSSGYWARASGDEGNQLLFIVAACTIVPATIQQAIIGVFKGFQKFENSLYITMIMSPVRLVLVIIFMALGYGVMTVILINLFTLIPSLLMGIFLLRKLVPLKMLFSPSLLSSDRKKQALRYSLLVAGMLGLGYLIGKDTEIFFLGLYRTVEDIGFFKLAYTIAPMTSLFPAAFGFVLLPALAEQFGKGAIEQLKEIYLTSTRYLMIVALPTAVGGIALADSFITVIYGRDYNPAITLFQIICVPIAIDNIANAGSVCIRSINRPGFLLITRVIIALSNVGLSLLLIPRYGILGAAIASSISLAISLPFYSIFVSRRIGVTWPIRDTIKIVAASIIMGVVVYALHSQINDVLSLALGIPLGVVIYIVAIFAFREINAQDIKNLSGIQNSLPSVLRKYYISLLGLMEKVITKK